MRWLTSMNKKRHQREMNRLIRKTNKSINSLDILNEGNEFNVIGSHEKITATVTKKEKL